MNEKTYVHLENGQIDDGPRQLPVTWRNVSGLNLLEDDTELAAMGWLPVIDGGQTPGPNQVRAGHTFDVAETHVTLNWTLVDLTTEEQEVLTQQGLQAEYEEAMRWGFDYHYKLPNAANDGEFDCVDEFAIDDMAWSKMTSEAAYITTFADFSAGGVWPTMSGSVTFASTADFLAMVKAAGQYRNKWSQYLAGSGSRPT